MPVQRSISRRRFLRLIGSGLIAATAAACQPALTPTPYRKEESVTSMNTTKPATSVTVTPKSMASPVSAGSRNVDVEIALRAVQDEIEIFPDRPTRVWRFVAETITGPSDAVQPLPDTYLGPILRLRRGQRVRIRFTNDIPDETIVHWHGLHVPAEMDGHPRFVIGRGETYEYEFEVLNRAGTYWYHPHPHQRTGPQVYMGMAGLLLVTDDEEQSFRLPSGEFDVPLVLQDRIFDDQRQFVYLPNGHMDQVMGFLGNTILVNGKPNYRLEVVTRPYRLRVLNGSNSRIYKLAWSDGTPITVIGNDGGLLERPVQKPYVVLGPGERVEIWADFSRYTKGTRVILRSLPFIAPGGMMGRGRGGRMGGGMMGGMRNQGANPPIIGQGESFDVLTIEVTREVKHNALLPNQFAPIHPLPFDEVINASTPRRIVLSMTPMKGWTLNGRTFEMTSVAEDEIVRLNTLEVWDFINAGGRMGMGMEMLPHPMHMHGEQFQVIGREVDPSTRGMWESVKDGFVDEGWKDTVLVMPGERVRVLRRFGDFTGLFLYHCHNLEHEDMGMMRNFEIRN